MQIPQAILGTVRKLETRYFFLHVFPFQGGEKHDEKYWDLIEADLLGN